MCYYRSIEETKTMDDKVHSVVPYGIEEFKNFAIRLLLNVCVVLIAEVFLERAGIELRDIVLGWVFLQVTWKGTVDDVLFKFVAEHIKHIKVLEDIVDSASTEDSTDKEQTNA